MSLRDLLYASVEMANLLQVIVDVLLICLAKLLIVWSNLRSLPDCIQIVERNAVELGLRDEHASRKTLRTLLTYVIAIILFNRLLTLASLASELDATPPCSRVLAQQASLSLELSFDVLPCLSFLSVFFLSYDVAKVGEAL